MHCDVTSMIFAYYSKRNFSRKKQNNEVLYKTLQTLIHFTLSLYCDHQTAGGINFVA